MREINDAGVRETAGRFRLARISGFQKQESGKVVTKVRKVSEAKRTRIAQPHFGSRKSDSVILSPRCYSRTAYGISVNDTRVVFSKSFANSFMSP